MKYHRIRPPRNDEEASKMWLERIRSGEVARRVEEIREEIARASFPSRDPDEHTPN